MNNSDIKLYAHFWVERSYGLYSLREQIELIKIENDELRNVIEDWESDVEEIKIENEHLRGRIRRLKKDISYWKDLNKK